jgi:hypothetical protein
MRLHPTAKLEELVVLTTTQTHSLGKKAALVLGLQCHPLPVRAEDQFSLRGEVLRQVLEHDSLSGLRPFIISGYHSKPLPYYALYLLHVSRYCRLHLIWSGRQVG